MPHEQVWTIEDLAGVTVWAPPGHWQVPPRELLRRAPSIARAFGRGLPRVLRATTDRTYRAFLDADALAEARRAHERCLAGQNEAAAGEAATHQRGCEGDREGYLGRDVPEVRYDAARDRKRDGRGPR
jgi:hypothetical protein